MAFILKPSLIHGVGVFTTDALKRDKFCDLFEENDTAYSPNPQPEEDLFLLGNFGIEASHGWYRPIDWRRISVGWYLNHSDTPNLTNDADCNLYWANRDINAGEELTINYDTLK